MPKVKDKAIKRKLNNGKNDAEIPSRETYGNSQKALNLESIAKSKQLKAKVKKRDSSFSSIEEPNMRQIKKPMPSLAYLEQIFQESDDEDLKPTPQSDQYLELKNKEVLLSSNCSKTQKNKIVNTITLSEQLTHSGNTDNILKVTNRKRNLNEANSLFTKDPGLSIYQNEMSCIENGIPTKKLKQCEESSNRSDKDLSVIIPEMAAQNADNSDDSNKTVQYDYHTISPNYNICRPFSPLPSTSKNNKIFLKNDLIFNQSVMSKSDVEIVEMPCETIILDDDDDIICSNVNNNVPVNNSYNEVINVPDEDEVYSTDYMKIYDVDKVGDSDCEIINIDSLIAENKALLDNYKKKSQCVEVKPPTDNQVEIVESNDVVETTESDKTFTEINKVVKSFFNKDNERDVLYNANTKVDQGVFAKIVNITNTLSSMFTALKTLSMNHPPASLHDDSIVLVSEHGPHPASQHNDQVIIVSQSPASAPNGNLTNNNRLINQRKKKKPRKEKETTVPTTTIQTNTNNVQANIPVKSIGDCPICMDNLSNSTVASTKCGHVFCMKCIKAAIQASGKRCPTCRKVLKGNGFHQLFL